MGANGRDSHGRFAEGNCGGPGRPPLAREQKFLETMSSVCNLSDWQEICERAVTDAKAGDHRAREWIAKFLVGEPEAVARVLHSHLHTNVPDKDIYLNASPEAIITALSAIDCLKQSCESDG